MVTEQTKVKFQKKVSIKDISKLMYWLGYEKTAVSDDFFDLTKDSERTRFSP